MPDYSFGSYALASPAACAARRASLGGAAMVSLGASAALSARLASASRLARVALTG